MYKQTKPIREEVHRDTIAEEKESVLGQFAIMMSNALNKARFTKKPDIDRRNKYQVRDKQNDR